MRKSASLSALSFPRAFGGNPAACKLSTGSERCRRATNDAGFPLEAAGTTGTGGGHDSQLFTIHITKTISKRDNLPPLSLPHAFGGSPAACKLSTGSEHCRPAAFCIDAGIAGQRLSA